MSLLSPAGGISYHLKALRFRRSHWMTFIGPLDTWMENWPVSKKSLLLVGPSAGYTLSDSFLSRFDNIIAVDPDPLAPFFFRRFHRSSPLPAWLREDFLGPVRGRFDVAKLEILLQRYPDSAVLFCNVIGQLPLLHPAAAESPSFKLWKKDLTRILGNREWASYHDRVSGSSVPMNLDAADPVSKTLTPDEIGRQFYEGHEGPLALTDHLTGDLFPGHQKKYLYWAVTPANYHVIEAVHHGMRETT